MKQKGKRVIAIALSAVMLSGCTGTNGSHSETGMEKEQNETETKESEETKESIETCVGSSEAETTSAEKENRPLMAENYNTLQTLVLLGTEAPAGQGIPKMEDSDDGSLYPFIRLGSATAIFMIRDWAVTDLSAYVENGYIQMEVQGDLGGETFEIGFEEMINGQSKQTIISSGEIIQVTDAWTSVQIPLKDIVAETGTDLSEVRQFLIGKASSEVRVRNISLVSEDCEKIYPAIKVNQLGYKVKGGKRALVSGFWDELPVKAGDVFELVDHVSGETVYSSELTLVSAYDEKYSGEKILCADFSDYQEEGTYYLRIKDNALEPSLCFDIGDDVYDELLRSTMRYYYYQRANTEITEEYGEGFVRQDQTPKDFEAPLSSDREVLLDVSGGWYDAGDVGKYVSPGATAANTLLWAYKMFPESFFDGQNNIPESGNGIPDILDEVKYELDFILKMQDSESGGFYIKVKSRNEQDSDGDRTIWHGKDQQCLTNSTADSSAVCAFASMIFREFDEEYADTLLAASERGWEYIKANPSVYTQTTYSGENNGSACFWAAACLYYASGRSDCHEYIKEHAEENFQYMKAGSNGHNVGNMAIYGFLTYLLCEDQEQAVAEKIKSNFTAWENSVLQRYEANPWNIAINEWSFWWGSFNIILGNSQEMYIGNRLLGLDQTKELSVAQDAVNFILGVNAMRKCYITGIGTDHIKCTFSNFYDGNSPDGVPAGYMPGGINSYNGGQISKFPIKCYMDDAFDWYTNENSIYWNAVMVFNTALVKQ